MYSAQINTNSAIPIFAGKDFFKRDRNIHIHISTEFPAYIGIMHKHKFIEIVYIISGRGTHIVGNDLYTVNKGDLFVINYDTPHAFCADSNTEENFLAYDLMFTPDFLDPSMVGCQGFESLQSSFLFHDFCVNEQKPVYHLQFSANNYDLLGILFNKIYLEYNSKQKGYVDLARAYVIELILKITRTLGNVSESNISYQKVHIVNTVLKYLQMYYQKNITLENLSNEMYLHKDYISKTCKNVTGLPVSILLQKMRIEQACLLLRTTDKKVVEIAKCCGFNDIKFFYKIFKKMMGVTPGDYRNKLTSINCQNLHIQDK
ncbi:MAG TPA: AraC family transcriptional regulator [Clostridiales bacterium]|nr:AraC family transcriptional regulator [Clostridiales bacterium]